MTCKACLERGKTWNGDDPKCAFETGVFDSENWNCATMGALRFVAEGNGHYCRDDESAGSIGFVILPESAEERGYIVMNWYKERGTTDRAIVMSEDNYAPLTLADAEAALAARTAK